MFIRAIDFSIIKWANKAEVMHTFFNWNEWYSRWFQFFIFVGFLVLKFHPSLITKSDVKFVSYKRSFASEHIHFTYALFASDIFFDEKILHNILVMQYINKGEFGPKLISISMTIRHQHTNILSHLFFSITLIHYWCRWTFVVSGNLSNKP